MDAIRELLLNSLIHRDYKSSTDIQIKIFDQKITFFNPGGLYGDLTEEDLKTDSYQASTRNKQLAEAFYLTHDIEKYGSGFIRIRKAIASYPTMTFDFHTMGQGFVTEFSYSKQKTTVKNDSDTKDTNLYVKDTNCDTKDTNLGVKDTNCDTNLYVKDTNRDTKDTNCDTNLYVKDTNRDTKDTNLGAKDTNDDSNDANVFTTVQDKILKEIIKNKTITVVELSEVMHINIRNIKNHIARLKKLGLLKRIGSNRNGYWQVNQ